MSQLMHVIPSVTLHRKMVDHKGYILLLLMLMFILSTSNTAYAKISLYDSSSNELISLPNVDFSFSYYQGPSPDYYKRDMIIQGKMEIAKFKQQMNASSVSGNEINDTISSPCTLEPISVGIALLVIPFDKAMELGCSSIDDLILSNSWITQDVTSPSNNQTSSSNDVKKRALPCERMQPRGCKDRCNKFVRIDKKTNQLMKRDDSDSSSDIPRVIVLTSTNGGDPGVKEPISDQGEILKAKTGLTLLRKSDMDQLMNLANMTSKVTVTSDNGPWVRLLKSRTWIAWSTILGVVYGLIFIFSCGIMCYSLRFWTLPENPTKFILNPNLFVLPGIAFCSMASLIILHIDPGNVKELISAASYSIIDGVVFLLLCIFYVALQYSWIKASVETTKCDIKLSPIVKLAAEFQRLLLLFGICMAVGLLFFEFVTETSKNVHFSTVFLIVNKLLFVVLMNLGYLTFGVFMIYDFATDREINQKIGDSLTFKFSSKADKGKALQVLIAMIILMVSFSFLTISNVASLNLKPTIDNFWKNRVTEDLSKAISMISMLILLRSHQLSRFLVNPVSSHLKSRPMNRPLHLTPEQIEEDERINSAAYTTRMTVVKPEPTYRINRLPVEYYDDNSIEKFRGGGYLGGVKEKGGLKGELVADSGNLGGDGIGNEGEKRRNFEGDGISNEDDTTKNYLIPKDILNFRNIKFTHGDKSEISIFDIIDL
ncbi:16767_t:CDS:2 [Acaulospora morrowiae]|uniref:16767_t:CDS:1 n=1 Tax=Acaulospora morrowiae TaxID=94023 RepID=A0A9N9E870_9GLOM|nr:16767_t:CDS:2 [Acaulospora morrowiae]